MARDSGSWAAMPARVIMQDASGVPVLADLADLEERVAATGASLPARPAADLVVDHSGNPGMSTAETLPSAI